MPFLVDQLLGTNGCRFIFYAQHIALENGPPGGWSFSNGLDIRVGF